MKTIKIKNTWTLKKNLILNLLFVTIITIVLASVLVNVGTTLMFKHYLDEMQIKRNNMIVSILESNNKLQLKNVFSSLDMYAMMNGLAIEIDDLKGDVIWKIDYIQHSVVMNHDKIKGSSKIQTEKIPIMIRNQQIGKVIISYHKLHVLSAYDSKFLKSINIWLIVSFLCSCCVAFLMSVMFAKNITRPLLEVIEVAHSIKRGQFKKSSLHKNNITEIIELRDTINHLSEILKNQENIRKRLTSDLAHELRTPLTVLKSHIEAIIDGIFIADDMRMQSIYEEIVRISNLISHLEALHELENNCENMEERFSLKNILDSAIILFEGEAQKKGLIITLHCQHELSIIGEREKMSQVIGNLLSNAIKYTEVGDIKIICEKIQNKIVIRVKDTGIGIPEDKLLYIFERLYRVDGSRGRETGGEGIGLSIVKTIIKEYQGEIFAKSRVGQGSEFIIELPC
ncbi:MAG: HAMP domain-containing sensor histidine kinase [Fusobacteria bacterium]|nr:HAMP domain-containing sensor histidine kinase [Fusobacteriota bacterium]